MIIAICLIGVVIIGCIIWLAVSNDKEDIHALPDEHLMRGHLNCVAIGQADNEYSREMANRGAAAK